MSSEKTTYETRLKEIMGILTQREFAERLGIGKTTLWGYLHGRIPPADFVGLVCERFNISERWFITGEGDKFRGTETEKASLAAVHEEKLLTEDLEKALIDIGKEAEVLKIMDSKSDLLKRILTLVEKIFKEENLILPIEQKIELTTLLYKAAFNGYIKKLIDEINEIAASEKKGDES
ncbi:MAG: helix-turn-helix domain-containing protein [Nitrospirae bacterium]|nr:helix-turn-helix domain-containing protein [Nitrospirota bacterium]